MLVNFTKMQGLGNDFVVVDLISQPIKLSTEHICQLADRHFGIGFDQLLVVEPPFDPDHDFHYRIFNADGSEVEQCGNGARCFARFVIEQGLTQKQRLRVSTKAGPIELQVEASGQVTVDMGPPRFKPEQLPFVADSEQLLYPLEVQGQTYSLSALSMGNPHAVLLVEDIQHAPVDELGGLICHHPRFPNRVNVGFLQIVDRSFVRLRVFERGAGETLACGTGACAAVVAGIRQGLLNNRVKVRLPGGSLTIRWNGDKDPVLMTGPATRVFDGQVQL